MKIFYTNIQSVFSKLNELIVYTVDHSPDIVLLTETWCNTTISDAALSLPSYQLETDLRKDRNDTTNGIGGGLLGLSVSICDKFSMCEFTQFCCFKIKTQGNPRTDNYTFIQTARIRL